VEIPVSEFLVFGAIILAIGVVLIVVLAGGIISLIDRADLRKERRRLADENKSLTTEVFELRGRVMILEAKLLAALEQIQTLSASLSGPPE
jgi:hypothetical protein